MKNEIGKEKKLKSISEKKYKNRRRDELYVNMLLVKYKKLKKEESRERIIEFCYPLIFSVLKKVGKKINTVGKLLDNEDLFQEGILIVSKCIEGYDISNRTAKFSSYVWVALERGFYRFINGNILKQSNLIKRESNYSEKFEDKEKEIPTYEIDFNLFESDFYNMLDKNERKIILLRLNKINVDKSCSLLNIGRTRYYEYLSEIKEKMRRNF